MRPHTLRVPKPMIEVNGEPFLAHLLRSVARQGVTEVVLLVGYLGEMVVEFAADGSAFGLRIAYVWDGEQPLGTAGAVRRALPLLGAHFLLTYGDAYLDVDYTAVATAFERAGRAGLMTVYAWNGSGTTKPNTAVAGGLVSKYDKETNAADIQYVDYGLSAYTAAAFDELTAGEPADLALVNRRLIERGELSAYIVNGLPLEIGSFEGLAATRAFLRRSS